MSQQLSQGEVGRITCLARLGCMTARTVQNGSMTVSTTKGIRSFRLPKEAIEQIDHQGSVGLPCLRAISAISKMSQ